MMTTRCFRSWIEIASPKYRVRNKQKRWATCWSRKRRKKGIITSFMGNTSVSRSTHRTEPTHAQTHTNEKNVEAEITETKLKTISTYMWNVCFSLARHCLFHRFYFSTSMRFFSFRCARATPLHFRFFLFLFFLPFILCVFCSLCRVYRVTRTVKAESV